MNNRAAVLANQFSEANQAVIQAVRACPEQNWSMLCTGENETVGAVANHVAVAYLGEMEMLQGVLTGSPVPEIYMVDGALDLWHARTTQEFQSSIKEATISHLERNGQTVFNIF